MRYLNETHFSGASGPLQFEGADRIGSTDIKQYVGNVSRLLGQFNPERNASDRLQINESMILWLTGSIPTDGSLGNYLLSYFSFVFIRTQRFTHLVGFYLNRRCVKRS